VPFNFLRRKKAAAPEPTPEGAAAAAEAASESTRGGGRAGISFDGVTEEWRLLGRMSVEGRLSDSLNKREAIAINDVSWAPIDGSAPFVAVPGLKSIDPYDLILVLAGEGSLPEMNDPEKAAHKVHKVEYDVALEAPPFRIVGTVFLNPGMEPRQLLDRATEMFVAVVDAVAMYGEQRVGDPEIDTILVNRFYLRGVEQVDKRTGLKAQKLPGAPLGGVSWQDRN
jgi:hypothetical protein